MTDAELAEIEKACAEAAPGPWMWRPGAQDFGAVSGISKGASHRVIGAQFGDEYDDDPEVWCREQDKVFVAGARTWVPALLAEVRRLHAEQRMGDLGDALGYSMAVHKARAAALEEAAKVAEGGAFLHDDAPDARFGRACAKAIRRLKEGE